MRLNDKRHMTNTVSNVEEQVYSSVLFVKNMIVIVIFSLIEFSLKANDRSSSINQMWNRREKQGKNMKQLIIESMLNCG